MKAHKKINRYKLGCILGIWTLCLVLFSCEDKWDNHFDSHNGGTTVDENLIAVIREIPDLSTFYKMLEITGYDKNQLNSPQAFTVWAPVNSAFTEPIDWTDTLALTNIVENHITRSSMPTNIAAENKAILMLAGKFIHFNRIGDSFQFGGELLLPQSNIAARNGILHTIEGVVPFQNNIWQYLKSGLEVDSIAKFLYSYDVYEFDEASSTFLGTNELGQRIYDSVFNYSNIMLREIGLLSTEDSVYTMILPTNTAWINAYDRIKEYFKPNLTGSKRDSVQDLYTKHMIVRDLVFRGIQDEISDSKNDSLISTTGNVFKAPFRLFEDAEKRVLSNGLAYITDQLRFEATESWHLPIVQEAEFAKDRTDSYCTVHVRSSLGSNVGKISNNSYLYVTPTTSSAKPQVTFSIPNTLSAKYDMYCVFVPDKAEGRTGNPTKVKFRLTYVNEKGASYTERNIIPEDQITDTENIKEILIKKGFSFPFSNYNEEITTVKIMVESDVEKDETSKYTRDMRIDCILLKPVK